MFPASPHSEKNRPIQLGEIKLNIHEIFRPEKRRWKQIRKEKNYEAVRQGYNDMKFPVAEVEAGPHISAAQLLLSYGVSPSSVILDAGCGSGAMCKALRIAGFSNINGFDISDWNVDATRQHANRVFRSTCEAISEPDASYDVVVCNYVIEHVLDVERGLSELRRILKPGGMLYISTDNAFWHTFIAIKQWIVPKSWPNRYRRLHQPIDGDFTPAEFEKILLRAGFEIQLYQGEGGIPFGDRLISRVFRRPTADLWFFRNFTTRMIFLARKK